jgi:hypothetical protein
MTTILVPTSGTDTDTSVFATAFALAQPLRAHVDFYHLRLTPCEAAVRAPHVSFCIGGAIPDALNYLEHRDKALEKDAIAHFTDGRVRPHFERRNADTPVCRAGNVILRSRVACY